MVDTYLEERIPISVLTGFLGSGKTTVLRHFLGNGSLSRTLILVNEFGEVGLDHHLLMPIDEDTLVALDSGCICCTIRADLAQTLIEAPWRYSRDGVRWFDQVIIETTGVADPAPVLQTILGDPKVAGAYDLVSVVTVVDAVNGPSTLRRHTEAARQVAVADRILITKTDLDAANQDELEQMLCELASSVPVNRVVNGISEIGWFFQSDPYSLDDKIDDLEEWLGVDNDEKDNVPDHDLDHGREVDRSRHGKIVASHLIFSEPVDAVLFESCLQGLLDFRGADLLRIKGIINVIGMDRPMVIHGVQHVFHPPEILERWPDDDRSTRIVIIAQDLDHQQIASCFTGFGLQAEATVDPE